MDNFMDKLAERYNAGEMIKANSQAEAAEMQNLHEQVEAYEAVLQEMRKLNYKNTELTEKMYSLVDESIEKVRTLSIEAASGGANPELISREMSDAVTGALNEALNNTDSEVARTISESIATALAQPAEEIKQSALATESVKESVTNIGNKVDGFDVYFENINSKIENIDSKISGLQLADEANKAALTSLIEENNNTKLALDAIINKETQVDNSQVLAAIEALGNKEAQVDNSQVLAAIETLNNKEVVVDNSQILAAIAQLQEVKENQLQSDAEGDELKGTVMEISAGTEELRNSMKNVKSSNEEMAASLKTAIDTAIYGLKQDNREIVEFMQRMNSNITAKQVDPDAEKKEEEAKAREEERRQAFEERLKVTEDFMHKESVKVYRNVQAVINEKTDRQSGDLEGKVKNNANEIKKVKMFAIIAAALSGLSLVAQVLQILGII